jgi:hypothetical protein
MRPNGTAHWVSGITNVQGGTTQLDVVYQSTDRTTATTTPLFVEGGLINGIATDDIAFDYDVSDNNAHVALQLSLNTGSTADDDVITLDSVIVVRELTPTGDGDNWDNFDLVRVNNNGEIVHSGDTDGTTTQDEYIAVGNDIVLREGQAVGAITLGTAVRGLALRNDGFVVWAWTTSVGTADEAMFIGQTSDLAGSSVLIMKTGDGLDTNGDMVSDYTIVDFEFTDTDGQGAFDFTEGSVMYTTLELAPVGGGTNLIAQVGLDLSAFLPTAGAPAPPASVASLAVSPNPIAAEAAVAVSLGGEQEDVTVEVLDVLGRRVAVLHDGPMAAGRSTLAMDARGLQAGVYVVRASGRDWQLTERVTVSGR